MALPIGSDLDLNNEVTIINVPPPVNGTDVVNKDYVDTLPGDNLGNHIATINLDMSGNDIIDANLAQINTINPPTGNAVLVRAVNNNIVIRSEDNSASNQNSAITLNQDNNIDIRAISGAGNTSNFFLTPSQFSYNISGTAIFSASSSGFNILPNTALLANFDPGASGEVLQSNGAGVAPSWVVPSINSSIDDLSDVDISTLAPVDNSTLYWDGTNYVPTNDVLFNTPNCIVDFTNEDGGDVCNTQYNSSSSAFWLGRKANGSKVAPTGVLANERITGFAAGAYDGGIFYIGSEVVFHATENQNGTHGGQDIRFAVTPSGTKARFEALRLEDDGTLSIRNNANYENLVTNDDDIPNKKYVDDAVASAGGLPFYAFAERTTSQSTNTTSLQYLTFNFTAPTDGIYKVSWNALLRYTSASNNIRARCQLDNSVNITNPGGDGWIEYESKDAGSDIRDAHGSTRTFFLAAGTHTLDFDFGRGSGNNTAWCYYATMDVQLKVI